MTKREELIEAAARAMWNSCAGRELDYDDLGAVQRLGSEIDASHALDAILAGLEEPNEEMETNGEVALAEPEMFVPGESPDALAEQARTARLVWRAMLQPLKAQRG